MSPGVSPPSDIMDTAMRNDNHSQAQSRTPEVSHVLLSTGDHVPELKNIQARTTDGVRVSMPKRELITGPLHGLPHDSLCTPMAEASVPDHVVHKPSSAEDAMIGVDTASVSTDPTTQSQSSPFEQLEPAPTYPVSSKTPQEITLAELQAQKAALVTSLATLPAIQVLIEESAVSNVELPDNDSGLTESDVMSAANKIVKDHIKLLHEYNELKDVGQGLMGLIADQRGVRIVEVQDEFGVDATD